MPSEANKIRAQCARKYGVREKAYKDTIESLKSELSATNARLADYDQMQVNYLKLVLYSGLSEEDRNAVLRSKELDETVKRLAALLGVTKSAELQKIGGIVRRSRGDGLSLEDMIKIIVGNVQ